MRKIKNPFSGADENSYNCFGCSPANKIGLHLEFWQDGEQLVAIWQPRKSFEGWAGILHGGIQATLMDEAAAWLVFVFLKTAGVTMELSTRFLKPVSVSNGQITIKATLISTEKRIARIKCSLEDGKGINCALSEVTYYCFPENIARAKYNYPGIDAFLAE